MPTSRNANCFFKNKFTEKRFRYPDGFGFGFGSFNYIYMIKINVGIEILICGLLVAGLYYYFLFSYPIQSVLEGISFNDRYIVETGSTRNSYNNSFCILRFS